jgi:hypothetical protein
LFGWVDDSLAAAAAFPEQLGDGSTLHKRMLTMGAEFWQTYFTSAYCWKEVA